MIKSVAPLLIVVSLIALPLAAQSGSNAQSVPEGWKALEAGDAGRAASLFHEELQRNPRDSITHYGAGVAAHMLGRERDATISLRRALELEPRLTDAARLLGELQYREGDVDDAIRTYEQALVHAPRDTEMQARLDTWRKEATLHRGLTQRNDGRFSVVFEGRADRPLADRAIATLDAAYWRIGKAIGGYPSSHISVTLYTEKQFRAITQAPDWADGLYDGRIRLPVKGALQNLREFDRTLAHELTHAMVSSLAPRGVPAWLHEGLASYFEPQDPARAVRMLRSTGILPFDALNDGFEGLSSQDAAVAYMQSLVLADALMRRVGTQMTILLQGLDRGQSVDQGLRSLGASVQDLEADLMRRFR
jgi:tetratricopeptide (TPR) repeat protein